MNDLRVWHCDLNIDDFPPWERCIYPCPICRQNCDDIIFRNRIIEKYWDIRWSEMNNPSNKDFSCIYGSRHILKRLRKGEMRLTKF